MQQAYQCALITGASSGIGAEFARQLPPQTNLILTGRNTERLTALAAELQHPERQIQTITADLAKTEDIQDLLHQLQDTPIDLFINNAGIGLYGDFVSHPLQAELHMLKVNVVAVTHLAHALLPGMVARAEQRGQRAAMVVLSSVVGFMPMPGMSTYAATKAYDLWLTEGLQGEFADAPIDILALCPGVTKTSFQSRSGILDPQGNMWGMDASDVVQQALASIGHRHICVPGAGNKASALLPRFFPRHLVRKLAGEILRRNRQ